VVKIFGREKFEEDQFSAENITLTSTLVRSERVRALTGPVNEVLASFAIAGVILYGGFSVISGMRSQGDFIAFLLAVFLLYEPFKRLSRVNSTVQQAAAGAERVFEILDAESSVRDPQNPAQLPVKNNILFEQVGFSYGKSNEMVLSDIDLEIKEGSKVAIVGRSGAGKSTLVDLIPRFMDPKLGRVLLGGSDLRTLKLADLRSRIAMVSQHTFLFDDTVSNNIAYGKQGATHNEVIEAAKAAHAYDFIMALPHGFETKLGEAGLSLSGGERQRLAIARALLKDAPILILDEATASLDNRSELEVQKALERLAQGRTTVIIAHRLLTVQQADYIVVLNAGRIVECGKHAELLNLPQGEYTKLYALQFQLGNPGAIPQ
jgi:subfamily B ATP-binding cassette protein MsbA